MDKNHNIKIINGANGIKSVKLNFTFLQALKLFYYKSNKTELLEITNNLQETEKIGNETDILKGLIGKNQNSDNNNLLVNNNSNNNENINIIHNNMNIILNQKEEINSVNNSLHIEIKNGKGKER